MSGPSDEEMPEGEPCDIHIRRNADGVERVYKWADHQMTYWGEFMWREGNFCCDCNRYLFFCRAADEDEEEEYPCGDYRYDVRIVSLDGKELFSDYDREHIIPRV